MAQPEKRENSVLFSLRELRQIEDQSVAFVVYSPPYGEDPSKVVRP